MEQRKSIGAILSQEMNTEACVQILDKAVCIAHSGNTIEKGMNLPILPPATGK